MVRSLLTYLTALSFGVVARADLVADWNSLALSAIRNESTAAPLAARNLAILHVAMHDAVNAVAPTHAFYGQKLVVTPPTSDQAAAAAAAHRVLADLFPSQSAAFDAALAVSLATIPNTPEKTNGIGLGEFVADNILDWHANDGSSTSVPYVPSAEPGAWRRTPPFFRPPELPQWPYIMCFALTNGAQLRPAGPPPLSSAQYAENFNQVKALGAANSTNRTAEQTLIARFWSDFSYTVTPPGHWNQIAQNVATNNGLSLAQSARLFALLNIAMADAGIAVWDAKYAYNFWRPVTAIQQADADNNPDTIADPDWLPLLNTPAFPEYVSGHSTFSKAAATVLTQFFGTDHVPFSVGSDSVPGVLRSYTSFAVAAEEIGMSRIYGGIHFLSAALDGLNMGRTIGELVDGNFLLPLGTQPLLTLHSPTNHSLRINVTGTLASPCVLEFSTNLVAWIPMATNTTPFGFQEPLAGPMRFYRARLLR